jgi:hypothetical protein
MKIRLASWAEGADGVEEEAGSPALEARQARGLAARKKRDRILPLVVWRGKATNWPHVFIPRESMNVMNLTGFRAHFGGAWIHEDERAPGGFAPCKRPSRGVESYAGYLKGVRGIVPRRRTERMPMTKTVAEPLKREDVCRAIERRNPSRVPMDMTHRWMGTVPLSGTVPVAAR